MVKLLISIVILFVHFLFAGICTYYISDVLTLNISMVLLAGNVVLYVVLYLSLIVHTKHFISFINQLKNKKP